LKTSVKNMPMIILIISTLGLIVLFKQHKIDFTILMFKQWTLHNGFYNSFKEESIILFQKISNMINYKFQLKKISTNLSENGCAEQAKNYQFIIKLIMNIMHILSS
jgi:hypothetical protein